MLGVRRRRGRRSPLTAVGAGPRRPTCGPIRPRPSASPSCTDERRHRRRPAPGALRRLRDQRRRRTHRGPGDPQTIGDGRIAPARARQRSAARSTRPWARRRWRSRPPTGTTTSTSCARCGTRCGTRQDREVAPGSKVGFCLEDMDRGDKVPDAPVRAPSGLRRGRDGLLRLGQPRRDRPRMGVSSGWRGVYAKSLAVPVGGRLGHLAGHLPGREPGRPGRDLLGGRRQPPRRTRARSPPPR